jgi:TorA maturation chaperone TorD
MSDATGSAAANAGGTVDAARFTAFKDAAAGDLELFAGLHDREPTAATIEAVQVCPIEQQLGLVMQSEAGKAAVAAFALAVDALPNPITEMALDDLAAGFADVYLRHTYRASPSESVWMTEDNMEQQAPMFETREWYRRHDLVVNDWARRPDDHLVIQLRFLAHAIAHAKAPAELADTANFLDQHLMLWIKKFAVQLVRSGAPDWYAAVAILTASYIDELRDHLTSLTGLARPKPASGAKAKARPSQEAEERPYIPGVAPSW